MSKPFPDKDKKDLLMTLLKVMGGRSVVVHFDGGGDSGNIEDAHLFDQDNNFIDLTNATFDWYETSSGFDPHQNKWVTTSKPVPNMPVKDILIKITEDALEDSNLDWYNNDGGYGQLDIDLTKTPPSITMEVHIREVHTDDHSFDYTYEEGEESDLDPEAVPLPTKDYEFNLTKGEEDASTSS